MTVAHVAFWHTHIQPMIDAGYSIAGPGVDPTSIRADVGWNWYNNFGLIALQNALAHIPGSSAGNGYGATILLRNDAGPDVPIGMLTVVPKFRSLVAAELTARTFAWFLADAPAEFYAELGTEPVLGVAKALLDTAMQYGLELGMDGSLLLHADPAGGQRLREFYSQKCNMERLKAKEPAISLLRRQHTDEYFYLDAIRAAKFRKQFDSRR
ncbi:hypothetical protein ABT364_09150 [Massilia sp. SR12]